MISHVFFHMLVIFMENGWSQKSNFFYSHCFMAIKIDRCLKACLKFKADLGVNIKINAHVLLSSYEFYSCNFPMMSLCV